MGVAKPWSSSHGREVKAEESVKEVDEICERNRREEEDREAARYPTLRSRKTACGLHFFFPRFPSKFLST